MNGVAPHALGLRAGERKETAMTKSMWVLAFGAVVGGAAWCWSASAQQPYGGSPLAASGGTGQLITHFLPTDGKPTALTIVDPQLRTIGVYHINRETGEIHLKSIRNIAADLQMDDHNSNSPLPREIRKGLERQPQ
jgi:hypothetical protein